MLMRQRIGKFRGERQAGSQADRKRQKETSGDWGLGIVYADLAVYLYAF